METAAWVSAFIYSTCSAVMERPLLMFGWAVFLLSSSSGPPATPPFSPGGGLACFPRKLIEQSEV